MTSSSEGEILQNSQIIRERWKIKQKIGGGGFGEIYEAIDLQSHNEKLAIKVESSKAAKQVLKMEVAVLRRLQGKKHACKFYGCGRNDKFNYLVMSLQGKNLADLRRESPRQCFSLSTSIRLAVQIFVAIREIHSIGFLHRDIKPSNFAMGRTNSTQRYVYMLDFGLARLYLNSKGEVRSPRSAAGFRGTVRYAAVSAHKNKEMGRQDDIWSLFYMLVEFLQGALPWRRIKDKDEVGRMKEEVNLEQLLDGCPPELMDFVKLLKNYGYADEPDYDMLEGYLWVIMKRLGIKMDDPFDWELGYENLTGNRSKATTTTTNTANNAAINGTNALALTGNVSTRLRSHTTAVRDRAPNEDNKNRALDTQAPITMGEDDDEQTGNYRYYPQYISSTATGNNNNNNAMVSAQVGENNGTNLVVGATTTTTTPALNSGTKLSSQNDDHEIWRNDKPKYKRQEFMRPKYGPVSFDVIDAVNARLAAASQSSENVAGGGATKTDGANILNKLRVETYVENDVKCHSAAASNKPPLANFYENQEKDSLPPFSNNNNNNNNGSDGPGGGGGGGHTLPRQQKSNSGTNLLLEATTMADGNKGTQSVTLSIGKWYQNGSKRHHIPPQQQQQQSVSANIINDPTIGYNNNKPIGSAPSFTNQLTLPYSTSNQNEKISQKRQQSVPLTKFDDSSANYETATDLNFPIKNEKFDDYRSNKSPSPLPKYDLHNLKDYKASRQLTLNSSNSPNLRKSLTSQNENKNQPYFPPTISITKNSTQQKSQQQQQQQSRYTTTATDQNLSGYLTPHSARKIEISPPLLKISHTKSYSNCMASQQQQQQQQQQKQQQENQKKFEEISTTNSISDEEKKIHLRDPRKNRSSSNRPSDDSSENRFRKAQLTILANENNIETPTNNNNSGTSLINHFKNLVNSFNHLNSGKSSNGTNRRRRSLSRGVSLDDARRLTQNRSSTDMQLISTPYTKNNGSNNSCETTTPVSTPTSGVGTATTVSTNNNRNRQSLNSSTIQGATIFNSTNCFTLSKNEQAEYEQEEKEEKEAMASKNRDEHNENDEENNEREMRRERRRNQRRKSETQNMFPVNKQDMSLSPTLRPTCPNSVQSTRRQPTSSNNIHRTMIISENSSRNSKSTNNNSTNYFVENRFLNNGLAISSTKKSSIDNNQQLKQNNDVTDKDYDNSTKNSLLCRRKRYQFLNFAPRALSKS